MVYTVHLHLQQIGNKSDIHYLIHIKQKIYKQKQKDLRTNCASFISNFVCVKNYPFEMNSEI